MQFKHAALAAILAGGAYFGLDALRGAPEGVAPDGAADSAPAADPAVGPPAASQPAASGSDERLSAADAERDQLRAALAAAAAERDALAEALSVREAEAAPSPTDIERSNAADGADAAAETERLLAELAGSAAEIDRLKAALAARDIELAALRQTAKILPGAGNPTLVSAPLTEAASADAAAAGANDFAVRLEAAKAGQPLPRPTALQGPGAAGAPLALVLFERASASLTAGATERAAEAAAALVSLGAGRIRITGHSDTTGDPARNMRLSRARAEAVAAALVAAGLPADRIEIAPLGEAFEALPIQTARGVSEPLNRCAGIYVMASAD